MGWTIEIEHSAGTVTLDENFDFAPRIAKQVNAKNVVEYVDLFFDIQGQVVAGTPADVATALKEIYDLVAIRLQPVNLTFKLDGVDQFSYTPQASVSGPTVLEMEAPKEDGNGGSKWAYALTLFIRLPGNNFAGLHDLRTLLTVVKNPNGTVITKVWQATARASTIAKALAGIMRFKPSGKVSEEIQRGFDPEPMVTATWIWRRTTVTYQEQISVSGGGRSYEVDPQAGVNRAPLLHLARRGAIIVRLDGIVHGLETDRIAAPRAHWAESATMKRQFALEVQSFPVTESEEDKERGRLILRYQEIYVFTGEKVPSPNHGSHGPTQQVQSAPADGAMAR